MTPGREMTDLAEGTRAALREMADALKAALDAVLEEARETQEQQLVARPAAQARQEAWLETATSRIGEVVALVALRVGGGSKDHPLVREFLPQLATGIVTAPIADRPRLLVEAAGRLAGLPLEFAEKAALVERLRETATALQDALAANDAARDVWSSERSEDVVAKNRLRLEMERTYGRLRAVFPGRRGLVESFFRKAARSPSTATGETTAPPAVVPQ